jgi:hypothetical protein
VGLHRFTVTAISTDGKATAATAGYTVLADNRFKIPWIKTASDGTVRFRMIVPSPGSVDVLETAWDDNIAITARLLQRRPAPVHVRPPAHERTPARRAARDGQAERAWLWASQHRTPVRCATPRARVTTVRADLPPPA